jgi:hypothetical protein
MKQQQAVQNLLKRNLNVPLETVPVTPTAPQRFTMSRNMKIAAGILGVAIVGGVIYLMSEDS